MKKIAFLIVLLLNVFHTIAQQRDLNIDRFLLDLVSTYELEATDIAEYVITDNTLSKKSKIRHFYFRQSHNGLEIIGTESSLHLLTNGEILTSNNNFILNKSKKIMSKTATLNTPESIIGIVAKKMNYKLSSNLTRLSNFSSSKINTVILTNGGISKKPIPVKKVFYAKNYGKIVLGWQLSIYEQSGDNWYEFIVEDSTGDILSQVNWKNECFFHEHNHEIEEGYSHPLIYPKSTDKTTLTTSGEGSYEVFAYPLENPHFGDRTLEVDPHNLNSSPFGWHDTNGVAGPEFTVTRGNNVSAYDDGDNPGFQPDGGSDLIFSFPFNPIYSASDQSESAAITNLFYWNNIIHDVMYEYGFDEESGNFQEMNYSGMGAGSDPVLAEAQDGSGTCNANFYTPNDGSSGVMQMYTCSTRDGDFDNHVIVHEYAHGITNRLTGGPSNSSCLWNDEQMGEGWSDWYGNMFTMTADDVATDLRPVGNWLFGQDIDGPGIRDYPYTTDLSQDPRTYNYISSTFGPHPLGSVWAAMLWEVTWGLIDAHGFDPDIYNGTGGNNIALALVTEALKLQPCSPGFVDGRDAILAADVALYGGANQCIIWDAFAKRGLGFSASQGSSGSRTDGVEAFDTLSTSLDSDADTYCELETSVVLSGGAPLGGVYSGPGVTDNGDGATYTFNPSTAGVGVHTITYTANSPCGANDSATDTIEVKDNLPEISCKDITVTLDETGVATILPEDIVTNFSSSNTYEIETTGTFNPIDVSVTGTQVSLGDDQVSSELPIGFSFDFFDAAYSSFYISSNGFITFNPSSESGCCSGQNIPNSSLPNNLIALGWSDLNPGSGGRISYTTVGTAPDRVLIVSFDDVPYFGGSNRITTQIKLHETTNIIEIHSTNVVGINMTQGIENSDGSFAYPVPDRNAGTFNVTNDFVAFLPSTGSFPDNCGLETTVSLDIDTFDCSKLGENTVTATATDTAGNSVSCTSIVTILPNIGASLDLTNTVFCEDEGIINELSGGNPVGGVYSGPGVTDDGNGTTFSFDPAAAAEGVHNISYEFINSCGTASNAEVEIEVLRAIPDIQCQDLTVELDLNGSITISPEQLLLGNSETGALYALNPFSSLNNIAKYNLDNRSDDISVDNDFSGSTLIERNYALDYNKNNGMAYILSAVTSSSPRNLFSFDLEVANGGAVLIDEIVSVNGNTKPQAMAFGNDGTLYFAFKSGEINAYDIDAQSISALAEVSANGAAVGLTYDFDNNRLIYAAGTGTPTLTEIDVDTGATNSLFSFSACSGQAIEYVGNGKIIASATFDCNTIYLVDLSAQSAQTLLNPTGSFSNIKDLLFISNLPTDNCNNEPLTFSLSQDTFDCSHIGENTVTVTATDNQGNSVNCTSIVTIESPSSDNLTFELANTTFCEDDNIHNGLSGGEPSGGVYSGPGVTDDGNGTTFSFNPAVAGTGTHDITYTVNACGSPASVTVQAEVLPAIPDIQCHDLSVELDLSGSITISPEQLLLGNSEIGALYALYPFSSSNNIARYNFDNRSDDISLDNDFSGSTLIERNYALDYNKNNGMAYILSAINSSSPRNLFSFDLEVANGGAVLIDEIVSVNGNTKPQAMAFGNDGTLYFAFKSGEINAYDIDTQSISALAEVSANGAAVGLTYDFDNNRLIYAAGTGTPTLTEIDVDTGATNSLFSFSACSGQAIEYVGNGKIIASSTFDCNTIYLVDLSAQSAQTLLNPTGSFSDIKDLLFISNLPTDNCNNEPLTLSLSQDTFDCSHIGENTVTVTATDNQGNSVNCTSIVTIESPSSDNLTFEPANTSFCEDDNIHNGLSGGEPSGGVYSGPGVTDDGNGTTFSFNPAVAGTGTHDITYTVNACGSPVSVTVQAEVLPAIPDIQCHDLSVELDLSGNITIFPSQLLEKINEGSLYALNPSSSTNSIAKYDYNSVSDEINIDSDYSGSTFTERNFALVYNAFSNSAYILSSSTSSSPRVLYGFDLTVPSGGNASLIGQILSVNGNTKPQAMASGNDGTLYFAFQSGEINAYDIDTQSISALAEVSASGAAVGLTYDFDNNRLIYAAGTGTPTLTEIDVDTGATNPLFSISVGCGAQAIEYVGDNKIIASSNGCSGIYTIDLVTQNTQVILNPSGIFSDIKDLLFTSLPKDNCNGEPLTLSLSQDTFDCSHIGENTVTVTATDNQGNSVNCTSIVTIESPSSDNLTFELANTTFCEDDNIHNGLSGGEPSGGVYSGPGVTDDGNGTTFSFNPAVAGTGTHDITYTVNACGSPVSVTVQAEVLPAIPDIQCQDLTVELDLNGSITISPEQLLLGNSETGALYALNPFSSLNNIAKYNFDNRSDDISVDNDFSGSTLIERNYALDYNKNNGMAYILSAVTSSSPRNLFSFDLEVANGGAVLIDEIVSVNGNTKPQAMAFGNDGTLYFAFKSGEINAYDIDTQSISALAEVSANGAAVGLTYDFDNNRLIYAAGTGTPTLTEIDVDTGATNSLFSFSACSGQAIEYVGNGKIIASATFDCNTIYLVDLSAQSAQTLLNPTGSFSNIKDLLFISNLPTDNCNNEPLTFSLSQDTFDCSHIGENTVTVTATDNQGNSVNCTTSVTVVDNLSPEVVFRENHSIELNSSGNASITLADIILSESDNCEGEMTYSISQADFSCDDMQSSVDVDLIVNGSFENGLSSWVSTIDGATDGGLGSCQMTWIALESSGSVCCCVSNISPTDGSLAAFTSFDSSIPNTTYSLEQTILLPTVLNGNATLSFDWIGEFNINVIGQTLNRELSVELHDITDSHIATVYYYALPLFAETSINESPILDITNEITPYLGQTIKLRFKAIIPESSTGPSKSLLDNIHLHANTAVNQVQVTTTVYDSSGNSTTGFTMVEVLDSSNRCSLSVSSEILNNKVKLFPNPVNNLLYISWSDIELTTVEVYDLVGHLVQRKVLKGFNGEEQLAMGKLSSGMYLVKISNKEHSIIKKIIKDAKRK